MPKAKARRPLKGRTLVALSLVGLVGISAIVIWRRTRAVEEAKFIRDLTAEKRSLISQRTTLVSELSTLTNRAHIVAAAEKRLGMHVATELEVRNLPPQMSREPAARDSAPHDTAR
ncbi:MAG: hypothetical protein ABJB66_19980 [Gemmatimonadaceae bacterium]